MLAAAVAVYVVGLKRPAGDIYADGLEAPVSGLPPVLLPAVPAPADVDHVRFGLGLRGYRMDQVDEVLDRLRDELAARDARIAELEAAVPAVQHDAADGGNPADAPSGAPADGGRAAPGDASGVEPGKES
nr:DivIVA domain-containing protein [Arthrobacter sp. SDTb3-6]